MQKELVLSKSLQLAELKELAGAAGPCITLYLPLEHAPNTSHLDFTRLKGGIHQVEQQLEARGELNRSSRELVQSLKQIEGEADQWGGEGGTLVVFRSPDVFRAFEMGFNPGEVAVVAGNFYVLPLIPPLQTSEKFYILALSQKHVRLLQCNSAEAKEVPLPENVPTNLKEWLNLPAQPNGGNAPDGEIGSFTSPTDQDKMDEHIANFYRAVNKGVCEVLRDERAPLILAGVDYELAMYKGFSDYPHTVENGVQGSPDSLKGPELHTRAREIAQEYFRQPALKALALWEKSAGSAKATTKFPEILKAAYQARVAHLFVAQGARTMGSFDSDSFEMTSSGAQEDLVNAAALQTVAFGGEVHILESGEMPGGVQMAALLRF